VTEDSFTPAQASAVAKLPIKAVHKLIDGRLIHPRRIRRGSETQRLLSREQLVYLRLEAEGIWLLPVSSRREVALAVESSPGVDSVAISGSSVLTVEVKTARLEIERELKRLRRLSLSPVPYFGVYVSGRRDSKTRFLFETAYNNGPSLSVIHDQWNRTIAFIVIPPQKTRSHYSDLFSAVVKMSIRAALKVGGRARLATRLSARMNGSKASAKSRKSNARSVSIAGFYPLQMT
jgi:hypothetical protein